MAGAREIKNRIRSIEDTKKITNAMYMISSMKLRKTRRDLEDTLPYFEQLKKEMSLIFDRVPELQNRYIVSGEGRKKDKLRMGCLLITSDKGLAGAYNHNILRLVESYMYAQRYLSRRAWTALYVVGEYGRQYFNKRGIKTEPSFRFSAQDPNMGRAREICHALLRDYNAGRIDEIHIIYTEMRSSVNTEVVEYQLLPIDPDVFIGDHDSPPVGEECRFFPSAERVLDAIVPSYITGYIYSALVDSFCSEQNERMLAMDSAGRSADAMLSDLSVQYNRVRQSAITQEITEVAAGARGRKK